ncbi:Mediator of RNA polymerase II transcription subunit 14, partial [Physocladia obscura]
MDEVFASPVPPGMVSLRSLALGLTTKSYAELVQLADSSAILDKSERNAALIAYSMKSRTGWEKLLVLIRWARKSGDLGNLMRTLNFLDLHDRCFSSAADSLFRIHQEMLNAREPNYDVVTAVDILCARNFCRLPSVIRTSTIPPDPLDSEKISKVLTRLEDLIRIRLFNADIVPLPFRKNMIIERGCVTFKVEHKFQVTLSLDMSSHAHNSVPPWKIVEVKILVDFVKEDYEGVIGIHDYQLNGIIASAAASLIPLESESSNTASSAPFKSASHNPLVSLHDHLDRFCSHLQMEILRLQAVHLAKTRWAMQLQLDFVPQSATSDENLKLRYWCMKTIGNNDASKYFIEVKLKSGSANSKLSSNLTSEFNPNSATSSQIIVRAYSIAKRSSKTEHEEIPLTDLSSNSLLAFEIDLKRLDIEKLILQVAHTSAKNLVCETSQYLTVKKELLTSDRKLRKTSIDFGEVGVRDANFEVWYRENVGAVNFGVDTRTGFINVSHITAENEGISSLAALGQELVPTNVSMLQKLKKVEDLINSNPANIVKAVENLEYSSYLDELVALAPSLDVYHCAKVPFNESLLRDIVGASCTVPDHFAIFQFPVWTRCFVLVAVGSAENLIGRGKYKKFDIPFYRSWIFVLSEGSTKNTLSAKISFPVRHENVLTFARLEKETAFASHDRAKRRRGNLDDFEQRIASQNSNDSAVLWNSVDIDIMQLILSYASEVALEYRLCFVNSITTPVSAERLAIVMPKIAIHPFFFDIQRKILYKSDLNLDRAATEEDKNMKYCFGNLYIESFGNSDNIVAKVKLTNEILPEVTNIFLDSPLAEFDPETSIISLKHAQGELGTKEILHHWKGLAAIAEVTSQIWTRRKWFKGHGIEIASYTVGTLQLHVSGWGLLTDRFDGLSILTLRWKRFVADKTNLEGGLDCFVLEFGFERTEDDNNEARNIWISALQQLLNECLDMVVFAKRLNPISNLLKTVKTLEQSINSDEAGLDEKKMCQVTPKSLSWVRVMIGSSGIDLYLFSNGAIGLYDAYYGCADSTLDHNLLPIDAFTTSTIGLKTFISSLPEFLKLHNASSETRLKFLSHGLIFSANVQDL